MVKTYEDNTYLHLVMSYKNYLDARVINKITGRYESAGINQSKSQSVDKVYGTYELDRKTQSTLFKFCYLNPRLLKAIKDGTAERT